jgi:CHAT domain-containing protein
LPPTRWRWQARSKTSPFSHANRKTTHKPSGTSHAPSPSIETQRAAIPDPETKTAFAERYFNAYTLQAQLALDQQQPQQAALALERSRARTLAELMFTRALPVPTNAPQALKDLIAQQEQLQRDFLLLARQQRQTDPDDTNALQRLQAMSRELADRQRQLDRQLREQFPAYADLFNPQLPAIPQLQAALDANTVLLYHAFADTELLIVAVSRQTVRGYRVKVDPRTLEKDLAEFQRVVAKPPLERTASERRKLLALGQRLYATLIKPAEPSLKNATTVLLCPEGALNRLPWGALIVAVDKQGRPTYWVERVALGITLSAGVYLQARAVRPAPRGVAIAAVSQYQRQQVAQASTVAQLVRRSGRALGDLPAVKQEVAQLRRELSKLGVVIAQESNATPARARQMAQTARVVHFACHARADGVDPLGSGLLLAPAGSDAGLLTAAEVVSKWRLRADVVMLSACETAVGQVRRYEGMYGLARAFLYAGARSVGASLWQCGGREYGAVDGRVLSGVCARRWESGGVASGAGGVIAKRGALGSLLLGRVRADRGGAIGRCAYACKGQGLGYPQPQLALSRRVIPDEEHGVHFEERFAAVRGNKREGTPIVADAPDATIRVHKEHFVVLREDASARVDGVGRLDCEGRVNPLPSRAPSVVYA